MEYKAIELANSLKSFNLNQLTNNTAIKKQANYNDSTTIGNQYWITATDFWWNMAVEHQLPIYMKNASLLTRYKKKKLKPWLLLFQ